MEEQLWGKESWKMSTILIRCNENKAQNMHAAVLGILCGCFTLKFPFSLNFILHPLKFIKNVSKYWIKCYLNVHHVIKFWARFKANKFLPVLINPGVPQGFALRPLIFISYCDGFPFHLETNNSPNLQWDPTLKSYRHQTRTSHCSNNQL